MMHPDMEKRIAPEEYDRVESRFVSEYGYPGPCRMASIEQYFGGLPVDRAGEVWALHNNTFEKHTVAAGISRHYTDPQDLPLAQYLFYASLVQALMLGYSLDAILCKPECHGALFWMYNDCWGETGWTIIDYYLRRKPCYYAVKRAFAPRRLVLREEAGQAILTAHNERPEAVAVAIAYGYVSYDGKTRAETTIRVELPAHSRSVALRFEACGRDDRLGVWFARAEGFEGAVLRRLPFRTLCLPKAAPTVFGVSDDGDDLLFTVSTEVFAHAVHFSFGDDSRLSDEYFDLLPGESRRIRAFGMAGKQVQVKACPPANA
jgi:beta-mannosidase